MNKYISRISSVEIPVSNLKASVDWYTSVLGLAITYQDDRTAMLTFDAIGVPGVYLVQTGSESRLKFHNSNNGITHSVVDFYTGDLPGFHQFLTEQGVHVGELNMHAEYEVGGFGFEDPDGNLLSACNAIQRGQV